MNTFSTNTEVIRVTAELKRVDGRWTIALRLPRWLADDLKCEIGATGLSKAEVKDAVGNSGLAESRLIVSVQTEEEARDRKAREMRETIRKNTEAANSLIADERSVFKLRLRQGGYYYGGYTDDGDSSLNDSPANDYDQARKAGRLMVPVGAGLPVERKDPAEGLAVGRIVHFVMSSGVHAAAIVTYVFDTPNDKTTVCLTVFSDNRGSIQDEQEPAADRNHYVMYEAEGKTAGTWHWPEFVR